jgi:hypothetical protein
VGVFGEPDAWDGVVVDECVVFEGVMWLDGRRIAVEVELTVNIADATLSREVP